MLKFFKNSKIIYESPHFLPTGAITEDTDFIDNWKATHWKEFHRFELHQGKNQKPADNFTREACVLWRYLCKMWVWTRGQDLFQLNKMKQLVKALWAKEGHPTLRPKFIPASAPSAKHMDTARVPGGLGASEDPLRVRGLWASAPHNPQRLGGCLPRVGCIVPSYFLITCPSIL